jgi:uncharacterized protein YacL
MLTKIFKNAVVLVRIGLLVSGALIGYFQVSGDFRGALIGFSIALLIVAFEFGIDRVPLDTLIAGVIGTIVGLIFAKLIKWVLYEMDAPKIYELAQSYSLLLYVCSAYLGLFVAVKKKSELDLLDRDIIVKGSKKKQLNTHVVDTSVLIDGRIADVCESKFLSGTLVVPRFILTELQAIADSADPARRAKGRRGMEILTRLQENPELPVKIFDKDFPEMKEVDSKLVALAKDLGAKILTTDFNLNKIASIQGATVLNVNDLASALKPVVLPGEQMSIFIVKEGKERDQGIGYLDDGTMVVIEEGRRHMGQKVSVLVTSILQTSAGRMIFTKAKAGGHDHAHAHEQHHDTAGNPRYDVPRADDQQQLPPVPPRDA